MQTNNINSLASLNALHADEPETSINPIIVKKEPGTGSLFPICTFETLVLYTKIRNNELVLSSRFPVSEFTVLIYPRLLTQIKNKELGPGIRLSVSY